MNFSRAPNGIKKLAVGPVSGAVAQEPRVEA